MRPRYRQALAVAAVGLAAVIWGVLSDGQGLLALLIGAASIPISILLAVAGRLESPVPVKSLIGGGTIGPVVAVLSHVVVFGFAYLFFLGFADEARRILDVLRLDPELVEVAGSPWTILFFVELVVVAPLTEEMGKAFGGWFQQPTSRVEAFMAGVGAGVGFAIVENVLYASGGLFLGPDWGAIVAVRTLGAAVHPLASGLVVLGWWEWRETGDIGLLLRRFFAGAGVHAIWNGTIVVVGVVGSAYGVDSLVGFGTLGITYAAGLGAVALAFLWRTTASVASEREVGITFDGTDAKLIGGWLVITASMLIPLALLFIAYPQWVGA